MEKTEIFGKGKGQVDASIALVVSLIFVGAVFPKIMVENLILYMSVKLVVIFVSLMFWGFVSGEKDLTLADGKGRKIYKIFAFLIAGSLFLAIFSVTGVGGKNIDWIS